MVRGVKRYSKKTNPGIKPTNTSGNQLGVPRNEKTSALKIQKGIVV